MGLAMGFKDNDGRGFHNDTPTPADSPNAPSYLQLERTIADLIENWHYGVDGYKVDDLYYYSRSTAIMALVEQFDRRRDAEHERALLLGVREAHDSVVRFMNNKGYESVSPLVDGSWWEYEAAIHAEFADAGAGSSE